MDSNNSNTSNIAVASVLDTSFLGFRYIGENELFRLRAVPLEGIRPVVESTIAHMSQIQGYVMRGDVIIHSPVKDEIETRRDFLDITLRDFQNNHARKELRFGCSRLRTATDNFLLAMHLHEKYSSSLDPHKCYTEQEKSEYNRILNIVRGTSQFLYNPRVTGKVHSAQSMELETDRKIVALAMHLAKKSQVVVYTNDRDLELLINLALPSVCAQPDLAPQYGICRIMAPHPDSPVQFKKILSPRARQYLAPVIPIAGILPKSGYLAA